MTITNTLYYSNINTSDTHNEEDGEACVANISPLERQKRMRFGIVQFSISLAILAVLVILHVNPFWRLPLFFMFDAAAAGYFQAKDKTWVLLSSRGLRKLGDTEEKIEDDSERIQIQRQAQKVLLKSFLVAVVLTLIAYLIP